MSSAVVFRDDAASAAQIAALLRRCDSAFIPPLSTRVDVDAYADKIAAHALRLEAWHDTEPVALLAMYCNDIASGTAYITSVSVAPGHARQGIASALLTEARRRAAGLGMRRLALEVDGNNHAALRLYEQQGYTAAAPSGPAMLMSLNLHTGDGNE
jgi:ribosomal-protein-alanine N-acetyltransferase